MSTWAGQSPAWPLFPGQLVSALSWDLPDGPENATLHAWSQLPSKPSHPEVQMPMFP